MITFFLFSTYFYFETFPNGYYWQTLLTYRQYNLINDGSREHDKIKRNIRMMVISSDHV